MRHGVKLNRLGRKTPHRKALMANLAIALIEHKRIITTLAKAKALRVYVEPMLTKSKSDTTHNRRLVFSDLQNKEAIKELFGTVSSAIGTRPGGYTRIIKMAPRLGDAAEMAMIELVDFNTIYTGSGAADADKKKTTRRSRGGKKAAPAVSAASDTEAAAAEPTAEVEAPVVDAAEEATTAQVEETPVAEAAAEAPEAVAEVEEAVAEATDIAAEDASPEASTDEASTEEQA
jgi:large subunit ribosomal protein L17